jgi:hypothetical protein
MRCLNCSTVLSGGDSRCISCGMPTGIRPGSSGKPGSGKGGAIAAILFGALLAFGAIARIVNGPGEPPTPPRNVKADELLKIENVKALPDPWIVYDASKIIETRLHVVQGVASTPTSRFVLLQVGDSWLIAEVPSGHQSARFEGRLEEWDTELHRDLISRVRRTFRTQAGNLLPFQLNAEHTKNVSGPASDTTVGIMGIGGLLLCLFGVASVLKGKESSSGGDDLWNVVPQ